MAGLLTKSRHLLRRFGGASEAVAAVEFAVILPFLLLLYLGSVELSALITVDRRVTTVAGSIGDLVARWDNPGNGPMPAATLADYFEASEGIMTPYSSTGLAQIVTCLYVDADGVATVLWSEPYNGGTAHAAGQVFELPTEMSSIALESYVIVSEAEYTYTPLLGYFFAQGFELYHLNYYLPRFGDIVEIA